MSATPLTKDRHLPNYFPIGLKLKGELVLIVGAGREALVQTTKLIDYGAIVHIIATHVIAEIQELLLTHGEKIHIFKKQFGSEEETKIANKEYALVFALNNKSSDNNIVVDAAIKNNVLVSVTGTYANAFKPANFIVPAFRKRGKINVSVSFDGLIHPLAKTFLGRIEASLGSKFDNYVLFLEYVKEELITIQTKLKDKDEKLKEVSDRLDDSAELISAVSRENFEEAKSIVQHIISEVLEPEHFITPT